MEIPYKWFRLRPANAGRRDSNQPIAAALWQSGLEQTLNGFNDPAAILLQLTSEKVIVRCKIIADAVPDCVCR
jgi:hypothetical protein